MKKIGKGCFGCFGIIGLLVVGLVVAVVIFDFNASDDKETSTSNTSIAAESSSAAYVASSGSQVANTTEEQTSDFNPIDVSDETIRSIKTYGDYLDMYAYVVEDYISYYESKLNELGIDDKETKAEFEAQRQELQAELDEAEAEYGAMRAMPLPTELSSSLAEILIGSRDMLRQSVDTVFSIYGV